MIEIKLEEAMRTLRDASDGIYSMIARNVDADGAVYVPGPKALSALAGDIETALWHCCQAVEVLRAASDHVLPSDGAGLTDIRVTDGAIIAYAPSLRRLQNRHVRSGMICAPLMDLCAERCVGLPTNWEAVDITVLTICACDTPEIQVVDPDNINPKRVIDDVLDAIGLEDNGLRATLHINAMCTDDVRPGAYVVFVPREYRGQCHCDTVIDAIMHAYKEE